MSDWATSACRPVCCQKESERAISLSKTYLHKDMGFPDFYLILPATIK
jgi:hypothetical protein